MIPQSPTTLHATAPDRDGKPQAATADLRHVAATSEQRVSSLVGDRLCAKCGYNLMGQAVLREPYYNMLIVRCPECASVASVQEYPLLGRWANRWATLLAGLWLLIIVGLWIGTGAAIFGFSIGTAETASWRYSSLLSQRYQEWTAAQAAASGAAQNAFNFNQNDWQTWWDQQDHAALFAEAGGWGSALHWSLLSIWIPFAMVVFALGCMWAVIMLNRRWHGRLIGAALIMLVAVFFSSIVYMEWQNEAAGFWWNSGRRQIGPMVLGLSLLFGAMALCAGMLFGRPVVRGLIRLMLPPRLRHSLAMLWTVDGLVPPTRPR